LFAYDMCSLRWRDNAPEVICSLTEQATSPGATLQLARYFDVNWQGFVDAASKDGEQLMPLETPPTARPRQLPLPMWSAI
jgi:hypothetical protein